MAVVPCYAPGTATGTSGTTEALVRLELGSEGVPVMNGGMAANPTPIATINQIGTVWGSAYQADERRAYFTTVLKRYAGLAQGLGHVYMSDPITGAFIGSFDLEGTAGGSYGSVTRNQIDGDLNELADDGDTEYTDFDAYQKVAIAGFGDTDIGPAGDNLWTVNLNNRTLVRVDVSDPTQLPTDGSMIDPSLVTAFFPDYPTCSGGVARPWGLAFDKGVGYLGVVCDGSSSPDDNSNLTGYILSFDPTNPTGSWQELLEIPFDYPREDINSSGPITGEWRSWTADWNRMAGATGTTRTQLRMDGTVSGIQIGYPQPIISDLSFADDGSLHIGVMDRFSMQVGGSQTAANSTGTTGNDGTPYDRTTQFRGISGGDLLKACNINGVLVLEGNAGCVEDTDPGPSGTRSDDGPGGVGEFYFQDYFTNVDGTFTFHSETSLGSVSVIPGTDDIIATTYDPIDRDPPNNEIRFSSQGFHYYSTQTGDFSTANEYGNNLGAYEIVPPRGPFGKASGLGDVILICDPVPIQIGNYVYFDENGDGTQQACEPALAGVPVSLYDEDGTLLATTLTDVNGEYYFSSRSADDPNLTWFGDGADTAIIRRNTYDVVFGTDGTTDLLDPETGALLIDGVLYEATTANLGNGPRADDNDSDVTTGGAFGELPSVRIMPTQTNHSFDAGFVVVCPLVDLVEDGGQICQTAQVVLAPLVDSLTAPTVYDYEWSTAGDGVFTDAAGAPDTDQTTTTFYTPGATDIQAQSVVLRLTSTAATTPASCPVAVDSVTVTILAADCGNFFWDGSNDE